MGLSHPGLFHKLHRASYKLVPQLCVDAKPHTVPSGTGDQLPVTSSGLGLGTQSPAIGWGLTGDWGLSLQLEGWDWGLSHQLMLGTAAGLGTGVPA